MKRKSLLFFSLIAILLLFSAGFMGCDTGSSDEGTPTPTVTPTTPPTGSGTCSGTVLDDAGGPVIGATVTLDVYEPAPTDSPVPEPTDEEPFRSIDETETNSVGVFAFDGMAEDVDYLITVSYHGKVTVQMVVNLANGNPDFILTMVNGNGETMFFMPTPITLEATISGATAHLSWAFAELTSNDTRQIPFDRYLLYRGPITGVGPDDTLVMEDTVQTDTSYLDVVPSTGQFFYVLYKRFEDKATGVAVSIISNEVNVSLYSMVWESTLDYNPCDNQDVAVYDGDIAALQGIYITDDYSVLKFDFDGTLLETYDLELITDDYYGRMAFDSEGNLYLTSDYNDHWYDYVYKVIFNPDGTLDEVITWGDDVGEPEFYYPCGIATGRDTSGEEFVYVTNMYDATYGVYKITMDGVQVANFVPTAPDLYDEGLYAYGVAVDPSSGNVYVSGYYDTVDDYRGFVMVFNTDGRLLDTWYTPSAYYNYDIAIDAFGNVYVTDDEVYTVIRYDLDGNYIQNVGNYGDGDGLYYEEPTGVCVDSTGNLYVATWDDDVQVFAPAP